MQFNHIFQLAMLLFLSACGIGGTKKGKNSFQEKPPFKIVVIEDYSVSQRKENKISIYKIKELADSIVKYGGILAYGSIETNSDQPFTELIIEQKPLPPSSGGSKNPFEAKNKTLQNEELAAYKQKLKGIEMDTDNRVANFLGAVVIRMRKGKKANYSDIFNAFTRIEQLVCAPKSSFRQEPKTYVIACSDMQDDWVGGNRERFDGFDCRQSNPLLIIGAQGSGNIELKKGEYLNLSSFDEAVRYVFSH